VFLLLLLLLLLLLGLQVPSGLLPVLEIDGRVVTESSVIMFLLEDAFPDHKPLLPPADSPQRNRAEQLMRLERRSVADTVGSRRCLQRGGGGMVMLSAWIFEPVATNAQGP
jgi:glutathione S-transferase